MIQDKGEVKNVRQVQSMIRQFSDANDGEIDIVVASTIPHVTDWWLLIEPDGRRTIYFGTPETFTEYQAEDEARRAG